MVPVHLPLTRCGRNVRFCASDPCLVSEATTPAVSMGHRQNDMLAEFHMSDVCAERIGGKPWPPYAGSQLSPAHPPLENCLKASANPGAAVTTLPRSVAPVASPGRLS